jgi:hypothetical protein
MFRNATRIKKVIASLVAGALSWGPLKTVAGWVWDQNKGAFLFLFVQGLLFIVYVWLPWQSWNWADTQTSDTRAQLFQRVIRLIHRGFQIYFISVALFSFSVLAIGHFAPSILNDAFREAARDANFIQRVAEPLTLAPPTQSPAPSPPVVASNQPQNPEIEYLAFWASKKTSFDAFPFDRFTQRFLDKAVQPFFGVMWSLFLLSVMGLFATFLAEMIGTAVYQYGSRSAAEGANPG